MLFLTPDWTVPEAIRAAVTCRVGGVSGGHFESWNLAGHVGDNPAAVKRNRELLGKRLRLPSEPAWLNQVHGTQVANLDDGLANHEADASFTARPGVVCAVLTADCLPILLTDGCIVAAIHAGWRGLLNGVLDNALMAPPWQQPPQVWLGPAIGPDAFEVGPEVYRRFVERSACFEAGFHQRRQRIFGDLYRLAAIVLEKYGITTINGGNFCTFSQPELFYSHRRDGICGRMATVIWRQG